MASLSAYAITLGSTDYPVKYAGLLSYIEPYLTNLESFTFSGGNVSLAGNFSLGASSDLTLNKGTANGVTYLNGSKVLTSGTGMTYDGTILRVNGSTTSGLRLASNSGATNGFNLYNDSSTDIAYLMNFYNGSMVFGVNNAEQMRLTSTGLGIGTSSPATKTQIQGASSTNNEARFLLKISDTSSVAQGNGGGLIFQGVYTGTTLVDAAGVQAYKVNATDNNYSYGLAFTTRADGGNLIANMRLDAAGNLGLGVTPSAWGSSTKAAQVGILGLMFNPASDTNSTVTHNAYYDGTNWRYISSSVGAARYQMTGANSPGSTHSWSVSAGGTAGNTISFTQAMTLDASGNLVLGTTAAASARLYVRGSGTTSSTASFEAANSSGATRFYIQDDGTTRFFGSAGSETARITSGGVLLVGTTSAPSIGGVTTDHVLVSGTGGRWTTGFKNTTSGTPWGVAIEYSAAAPNDTSSNFLYCYDSAPAVRMSVRSNGGIANYSGNDVNLSDRREKTNFAPAKSYLDTICAIPVQTFNYIDQSEEDPGLTLGVVAQDVQAVAPELVMESNWGTEDNPKMRLSIYQTDLQYALMKCIQEQQAIINDLRARVAALEA